MQKIPAENTATNGALSDHTKEIIARHGAHYCTKRARDLAAAIESLASIGMAMFDGQTIKELPDELVSTYHLFGLFYAIKMLSDVASEDATDALDYFREKDGE